LFILLFCGKIIIIPPVGWIPPSLSPPDSSIRPANFLSTSCCVCVCVCHASCVCVLFFSMSSFYFAPQITSRLLQMINVLAQMTSRLSLTWFFCITRLHFKKKN
jgi:hypothetical protein